MTMQHVLAQLNSLRAEVEHDIFVSRSAHTPMTQRERNLLGIQLRNALQAVHPKYAGCTVWVDDNDEFVTIANLTGHAPVHTTVQRIRDRIAKGRNI